MNNVLWLVSWYPNRLDAFDGDFIERHAKAVSGFAKLTVLLVVKDETLKSNQVEIEKQEDQNLVVYRVYYGRSGWGGIVEKLLSLRKYLQLQKKMYRQIVREKAAPSIVHVHVAMKAGILARWLNKNYQVPYIVTEHWTGYNPQSQPNIYSANWLYKRMNKQVLEGATLLIPVSDALGKMVNQYFATVPYQVIPNVVNTGVFYHIPFTAKRFRFIHPSFMNYQKNPEGILAACKIVKDKGYDFELLMLGNKEERLQTISKQYNLQNCVIFEPAVLYPEVAKRMQESSALLLFSRFENLPCVILEAMCCGLPVISSNVGGIQEVISKENGILVESENIAGLANAMIQMIENYSTYNRAEIAAIATVLYNYDKVGKQYAALYHAVLNPAVKF